MVEQISWADATIDEISQDESEQPSMWDEAGDFALDALRYGAGAVKGAGGLVKGALIDYPVGVAAGALIGPFVDGAPGPDGKMRSGQQTVEDFTHEFLSTDKAVEGFYGKDMPAPDPIAQAGEQAIMGPAEKIMDVAFWPAEKAGELAEKAGFDKSTVWGTIKAVELGIGALGHGIGKRGKIIIDKKLDKARKATTELAVIERQKSGKPVSYEGEYSDIASNRFTLKSERAAAKDIDLAKKKMNDALNELNESTKKYAPRTNPELNKAIAELDQQLKNVKVDPIADKAQAIKKKIDRANKILKKNPTGAKKLFDQIKRENVKLDAMIEAEAQANKPTRADGPDYMTGREQILDDMRREQARYEEVPEGKTRGIDLKAELDQKLAKREQIANLPELRPSQEGKGANQILAQFRDSGLTQKEFLAQRQAEQGTTGQSVMAQIERIRDAAERKAKSKSATQEEVNAAIAEAAEANRLLTSPISGQAGMTRSVRPTTVPEPPVVEPPVVGGSAPLRGGVAAKASSPRPFVQPRRFAGDETLRSINEQRVVEPPAVVEPTLAEQAAAKQANRDVAVENQRIADAQAAVNERTMRVKEAQAAQLIEANDAAYRAKMKAKLDKAITNRPLDDIVKDVSSIYNELLVEADSVSRTRVGELLEQAGEVYEQAMSAKRRRDLTPAGEGKRTAADIKADVKSKATPGKLNRLKAGAQRAMDRLNNERGAIDVRTLTPETRASVEQMIVELRKKGKKISKFIEEQGYTRDMLVAMRQVAKEMDRDQKLSKQAGVKNDIGGRRRVGSYKNAEGNRVDLFAPDTLPSQEVLVKEIKNPVNRWGSGTSHYTMKGMESQVMDLWGYPHRENQGMTARANTRDAKMLKSLEKPLSRKDRLELSTETWHNQRGGKKILEDAGWEVPTVELGLRSSKAAEVYPKLREFYDKLHDQVNVVREKIGLKPMNKVENYATLFRLFDEGKTPFEMITADLNKLTHQHTKTTALVESKHRSPSKTLERNIEMDAFTVANRYAQHANRFINEAEHLARMHEHLNEWKNPIRIPKLDIDGVHRVNKKTGEPLFWEFKSLKDINPSAHTWLMNWKDYQAGMTPISNMNVNIQKAMKQLSRHTVWGMMAANVTSGLNQLGAWVQAGTVLNHHLAGGLMDVINSTMPGSKKWQFMMDNSAHMPQRFGNFDVAVGHTTQGKPIWTGKGRIQRAAARFNKIRKPIADATMKHVSYTDMITAATTWFGGYRQGMKLYKGNKKKAIRHADDVTISTNASASTADRAPIQRHPLGAFVTTLQTFALANWDFIAKDVFGWKNPQLKTPQRIARVTKLLAGMSMLGYLFEDVLDVNSPMPNPVREIVKGIEDGDDLHEIALAVGVELTEVLPGAGSVIKYRGSLGGAVTGKIEDVLSVKDSPEKAFYGLAYLMGLPGVSQVKKSARQIKNNGSPFEILTGGMYKPQGGSGSSRRRKRRTRSTR
jgi:hypothetical protein